MAIASIKCEVVPSPVCNRADAVTSTHEVEDVEEEPTEPSDRTTNFQPLDLNDRFMAPDGSHRTFILVNKFFKRLSLCEALDLLGDKATLL